MRFDLLLLALILVACGPAPQAVPDPPACATYASACFSWTARSCDGRLSFKEWWTAWMDSDAACRNYTSHCPTSVDTDPAGTPCDR